MLKQKMAWNSLRCAAWFSPAILIVGLVGCNSVQRWDPGAPDALTVDHYGLAVAAIEAKSQQDAQAAFYLLRADVLRMRANTLSVQAALAQLYRASNQVDREDWVAARNSTFALKGAYGRP
jgi:hypothetical protein